MLLLQLFITFFKIGAFGFGGGYGMIPLMEKEVVTIHGWLDISEMVDIIAISQMTPGPIGINLATFVGYKTGGIVGSVVATTGVVSPSVILIIIIAKFFFKLIKKEEVQWVMKGIHPAVVALIAYSAFSIGGSVLTGVKSYIFVACAFILVYFLKLNPIAVIIIAGIFGIIIY